MDLISMRSFAKQLNDLTFTDYFTRLKLLAQSVFKWENLPNGIEERYIEQFLFEKGKCVFYNDWKRGLMIADCVEDGDLNNYNDTVSVTPTGIDVDNTPLTVKKDCVLIRNNDLKIPTDFPVKLFAYRLAEISRTIDINIGAQKTPILILTSEKGKLTVKNVYAQYKDNEPVIIGDKNIDPEMFKVLKTDAPKVFSDLQQQKLCIWNECLTFLGINNANTEKRERLITGEVEANNTHIDLSADCFLKARETACEDINKIFETNISVRLRREDEIEWQNTPKSSES